MKKIFSIFIFYSVIILSQDYQNNNLLSSSQIKDRIFENLDKLEMIISKKLSPRDYTASKELLVELYLLLFSIPDFEFDNQYIVMSDFDFKILLADLKNESFTEDKLTLIQTASLSNYFTVSQVFQILENIDFNGDRIEALRLLLPSIVDKYNAYRLLSLFENSTDKQTVRNIISNFNYRKR